jgi:protein O-mannosyl-transferase
MPVTLIAAVLIVFSNSLQVPFLLDDFPTIPGNPSIQKLSPLSSVLFPPPHVYSAGRPLLNLSFALNHAIGGMAVGGYHIFNVLIHAAATLVLFGLVRRGLMLPGINARVQRAAAPLAFIIAGLWALHPLQTNSVTYISQRAESLMGLFYLLTLYCFLRGISSAAGMPWKIASIAACALGMATKEVMVTAPVIVFLLDATCVSGSFRRAWMARWRWHAGLAATWILLAALMVQSELGRRGIAITGLPWYNYAQIECLAVAKYLSLSLWPRPLIFDHGANLPLPSFSQLLIPASVLLTLGGLTIRELIRCRVAGFLGAAFFVVLAPTSSVVAVAGQPIAENRMYLPLAAVLTTAVAGAFAADRRAAFSFAAAIAALGWLAHERNEVFRSAEGIWRDTVEKQPGNMRAWVYYAEALKAEGRLNEAITVLLGRLRHGPPSAEIENNAAVALFTAGRVAEAIEHYQAAIRINPAYAEGYYNFGASLFRLGKFDAALEAFLIHLRLKTGSVEVHNYAGLCLVKLGRFAEAIPHFQRAVELDPAHPHARGNLEFARAEAARTKG